MPDGIAGPIINKQITSPDNPRLKAAIRLKSSRGRKTQRRMIIFGYRELQRAVQAGITPLEIFVDESLVDPQQLHWLESFDDATTTVYLLPARLYSKLRYGERADAVVAVAPRPPLELAEIQVPPQALVVILESIEKPGNIGAVLRSADGAGASALVLADPQCDPLHPNCIRASLGTVFALPLAIADNADVGRWVSHHHLQLLLACDAGPDCYTDVDMSQPTAIVFGNEASGLSDDWTSRANAKAVSIPMLGVCDSLNVSVAAAVILYEARRQRGF